MEITFWIDITHVVWSSVSFITYNTIEVSANVLEWMQCYGCVCMLVTE